MNRLTFVSTFVLSACALAPLASADNLIVKPNVPPVATQVPTYNQYLGTTRSLDLMTAFKDPDASAAVRVETVLGTMNFTLDGETTPITVANFLNYVNSGRYYVSPDPVTGEQASLFFHRSVPNFILQCGGWIALAWQGHPTRVIPKPVTTFPKIQNEPVISNRYGTIAMAKLSNDPNSATSQWFINLRDNSHRMHEGKDIGLDVQNEGFTVFGRVAGAGMDVAEAIAKVDVYNKGEPFDSFPLRDYNGTDYVRLANVISVPQMTQISPLQFSASSNNTAVATVAVSGTNLLISATQNGSAQISVTATDLDGVSMSQTFTVNVVAAATRLLNISTRAEVRTESDVLIGGFIVQGGSSKRLLVRAIGPSLAADGVSDPLDDPFLELRDKNGVLIADNNNWGDAPNRQEIVDTGVAPQAAAESAILTTVPSSSSQFTSYTAIVRPKDDKTGVGLVEVYDLDSGPGSTLANISTRGRVGVNDDVMIGGFILGGSEEKEVLLRAIGPSLANSGVANTLSNPTLELRNSEGTLLASNDNWEQHPTSDRIEAMNLDPAHPLESALIHRVAPAAYTAIIRGTGDTPTGVALVEVYQLP